MRLIPALRRFAVVAASSALLAGVPVAQPAFADEAITNVSPTGWANDSTPTVTFKTGAEYALVPIPTVTFVRNAHTADTIAIASEDVSVTGGTDFSVPVDLDGRNPGLWNIVVSGTVLTPAPETVVSSCTSCFTVHASTPSITSISPTSIRIAQSATPLTITGTNFTDGTYCVSGACTGQPTVTVSGTGVTLANNGAASETTIPLTIAVEGTAATGFRTITVTNTDGKTDSCTDCLLVTPNVSSVAYEGGSSAFGVGASHRVLTINGNGFQNGATVSFQNPSGITINNTTWVSAAKLEVELTLNEADSSPPTVATHQVTVTNPDGGASNSNITFSVQAGPTLTSVSPASRGRGATADLTLTGTSFATSGGVTVTIPGVTINSTTVDNATTITLNVTVPSGATAGPRDVTVLNNTNKGQHTCEGCFTVDNLQVDSISPTSVFNDQSNSVTVNGTGFAADATVKLVKTGTGAGTIADIPGTAVTVNGGGTQISATFATTGVAPGTWTARVTNPTTSPGTGACTCSLDISASTPSITTVSPDNRGAGAEDETITITGTGFMPGAVVSFSNAKVHVVGTPVVTPTQITVVVDIDGDGKDPVGPPPAPSVTVTNTDAQADSADFTVNAPPIALAPEQTQRAQGTSGTITFNGNDISATGATVLISGTGITAAGPWTFTDGNGINTNDELTGPVVVAADAPLEVRTITIRNSDGGRATCATCTLTINPQPTLDHLDPAKAAVGQDTVIAVHGSGFLAGATVAAGPGITATVDNVTSTVLTVSFDVAPGTATGNRIVTVNNTDGGSASKADALKLFTVPGPPTGPTATRGTGEASVSWTAPVSDGNDPITSYTITSSPGGLTKTVDAPATSGIVTGLTNGTTYTFTVVATNPAGNSPASSPSNSVVPATVPDAPTAVTATAGNAEATVSWAAPAFNGGDTITGYKVTSSPGAITKTVDAPATNTTLTGLTNGTTYTFTVQAINAIGTGAASDASNSVIPATVPDKPTSVTAAASDSSAMVSWTAPFNGGSPITGFTATSSPGGLTGSAAGDATSVNVTGLTNGVSYTFTVTATNAKGTSLASDPSAAVVPFTIPGAPTAVTATALARSASVSWTAPSSNGGNAITGYTVSSNTGGHTATVNGSTLTATVTGLTPGQSYSFSVVATNTAGNSAPSALSNAVTPYDVPGAPTGVSAVRGDQAATVSWVAPVSNGGSPLTGFTVTSSPGGITKTVNDGTATSTSVTGLTNGTAYTFTVVAHNAGGNSLPSSASNSVTPAGVPLAPPTVTATAGHAAATVTWTAADGNGAPVTGYTVTASPGGSTKTLTGLSTTFTGLSNGTLYTFTVRAINAVGTGAPRTSNGVRPTWVTKLTEGATTVLVSGGTATVSGKLTRSDGVGIVGATLKIYRRTTPSTTYVLVRSVTTGTGGAWKVQFSQTRNTYYQARFAGSTAYDAVNSPARLTLARYKISPTWSLSGRTVTVRGTVSPNAAGRNVFLQYRRSDGRWITLKYMKLTSTSTFRMSRSFYRGRYTLRVLVNSSSTNYTNYAVKTVSIP